MTKLISTQTFEFYKDKLIDATACFEDWQTHFISFKYNDRSFPAVFAEPCYATPCNEVIKSRSFRKERITETKSSLVERVVVTLSKVKTDSEERYCCRVHIYDFVDSKAE